MLNAAAVASSSNLSHASSRSAASANTPVMKTTDVQAILRLVGGAAELWYEPTLQRQFTLDSLCRMLDAKVGVCFTLGDALVGGMTPCSNFTQVGLDATGVMLFE